MKIITSNSEIYIKLKHPVIIISLIIFVFALLYVAEGLLLKGWPSLQIAATLLGILTGLLYLGKKDKFKYFYIEDI